MKVVSFVNKKGGVGKTTLCLHLAAILASKGKQVLIIDNDGQCNITSTFNLDNSPQSLYDVMINPEYLFSSIEKTNIKNLDVVPNKEYYQDAITHITSEKGREFKLRNAINNLKVKYDYIFIDCNPSMDLAFVNALVASNEVIIPIGVCAYSLTALSKVSNFIDKIKNKMNPSLEIKAFVLNDIDRRSNMDKSVAAGIDKAFPGKLAKTTISRSSIFTKMQFKKQTLVNNKLSKSYSEYKQLLKELGYYGKKK